MKMNPFSLFAALVWLLVSMFLLDLAKTPTFAEEHVSGVPVRPTPKPPTSPQSPAEMRDLSGALNKLKRGVEDLKNLEEGTGLYDDSDVEFEQDPYAARNNKWLNDPDVLILTGPKPGADDFQPELSEEAKRARFVVLNFEAADVFDIIVSIAELMELDYIIESGISGKITIRTTRKIPVENLFNLLEQVLAINGISVVKIGEFYRFIPMAKTTQKQLPIYYEYDETTLPFEDRLVIQIIPLRYLPIQAIQGVIRPFMSDMGSFITVPNSKILIVIDLASNIPRLVELIKALDVNTLDQMQVQLIPIRFSQASDLVTELTEIFSAVGYKEQEGATLKFVVISRLNAILLINAYPDIYPTIQYWITKLDQPVSQGELGTYVYYVQNGEATDLASILQAIYQARQREEDAAPAGRPQAAIPKPQETPYAGEGETEEPKTGLPTTVELQLLPQGEIEGFLQIVPHAATNSLIIRTRPQNYPIILDTIQRLDLKPLQVMIEVLVAELRLTDELDLGLEWALKARGRNPNTQYVVGQNVSPFGDQPGFDGVDNPLSEASSGSGISFFTHETGKLLSLLHVFAAESRLSVRASPIIMTSENKEATIDIVEEVPVQTQTTVNQVITQSIEYRSVGIRLSVTPKINEERFVTLDVSQELSEVNEAQASLVTAAGISAIPLIRRQARTSVIVRDKETLVIGGLIRRTKSSASSGTPFFSKIPVFGWLFGSQSTNETNTELLIFITPHVITDVLEARSLTDEFERRLKILKTSLKPKKR